MCPKVLPDLLQSSPFSPSSCAESSVFTFSTSTPYNIWVQNGGKSEKIAEKWQYFFENLYFAILVCQKCSKRKGNQVLAQAKGKREVSGEGKLSRAYAQRAPSNSDVDFLLSQVSQFFGKMQNINEM